MVRGVVLRAGKDRFYDYIDYDTAMDSQSFEHEKRHGGQWAILGWGFMAAYAVDWLGAQAWYDGRGRPESCDPEVRMFLERSAGLEGEYSCECGK